MREEKRRRRNAHTINFVKLGLFTTMRFSTTNRDAHTFLSCSTRDAVHFRLFFVIYYYLFCIFRFGVCVCPLVFPHNTHSTYSCMSYEYTDRLCRRFQLNRPETTKKQKKNLSTVPVLYLYFSFVGFFCCRKTIKSRIYSHAVAHSITFFLCIPTV